MDVKGLEMAEGKPGKEGGEEKHYFSSYHMPGILHMLFHLIFITIYGCW